MCAVIERSERGAAIHVSCSLFNRLLRCRSQYRPKANRVGFSPLLPRTGGVETSDARSFLSLPHLWGGWLAEGQSGGGRQRIAMREYLVRGISPHPTHRFAALTMRHPPHRFAGGGIRNTAFLSTALIAVRSERGDAIHVSCSLFNGLLRCRSQRWRETMNAKTNCVRCLKSWAHICVILRQLQLGV